MMSSTGPYPSHCPTRPLPKPSTALAATATGNEQFRTRTTDTNGIIAEQFTDVRGRVTAVKNITSDGNVWTSFAYNAINEQVAAGWRELLARVHLYLGIL